MKNFEQAEMQELNLSETAANNHGGNNGGWKCGKGCASYVGAGNNGTEGRCKYLSGDGSCALGVNTLDASSGL